MLLVSFREHSKVTFPQRLQNDQMECSHDVHITKNYFLYKNNKKKKKSITVHSERSENIQKQPFHNLMGTLAKHSWVSWENMLFDDLHIQLMFEWVITWARIIV